MYIFHISVFVPEKVLLNSLECPGTFYIPGCPWTYVSPTSVFSMLSLQVFKTMLGLHTCSSGFYLLLCVGGGYAGVHIYFSICMGACVCLKAHGWYQESAYIVPFYPIHFSCLSGLADPSTFTSLLALRIPHLCFPRLHYECPTGIYMGFFKIWGLLLML